jgi:hypothetical protein
LPFVADNPSDTPIARTNADNRKRCRYVGKLRP